jgi:penicillin amidase
MLGRKRKDAAWTLQGDGPIDIRRDGAGVPHVRATTEADVLRGLGHCHGVDRALQLIVTRIVGQGRAAEILDGGDEMVAMDTFFRRIDLVGGTQAQIDALSPRHRALLEAYADGVNRAIDAKRPWELRLLRHRPEPWIAADSVLMGRMIGYIGLAQTQGEAERWIVQMLGGGISVAVLDELFAGRIAGFDESLLQGLRIGEGLVPDSVRWHPAAPVVAASNNWAIAPSRTASGSAILANDPHLEINRLPAIWYEAQLDGPQGWLAGASMPGVPAILVGRSEAVSWGVTYAYADVIDSWVEDCRDGCHRRDVDGEPTWEPFVEREEIITRRKGEAVTLRFHENLHGTLAGDPAVAGRYLATRWAGREGGAVSLAAALELPAARTASEAGDLLSQLEWAFNWVLADRDGSIVYRMSGRIPRRRDGASGLLPLAGWRPQDDWQGFHVAGDLPRLADPPQGWVATANEDLNHLGVAKPITLPGPSYRAERIAAVLGSRSDWTVEQVGRLQMDVLSLQAQRFLALLAPLLDDDKRFTKLLQWDGSYADSRCAEWFEAFYIAAVGEVLTWVGGPSSARYLMGETDVIGNFFWLVDDLLLGERATWAGEEGRDAALRRLAIAALTAPKTPQPPQMMLRHMIFGRRLPPKLGFDHGPVPVRGGRSTVHQSQVVRIGGREVAVGPSVRLVTDMAQHVIWTALIGGPSDRRYSRWYTSGVADWRDGRLKAVRRENSRGGRAATPAAAPSDPG